MRGREATGHCKNVVGCAYIYLKEEEQGLCIAVMEVMVIVEVEVRWWVVE